MSWRGPRSPAHQVLSVIVAGFLWLAAPGLATQYVDAIAPGVRIESVDPTSVLARAGLEPGDVILSWSRAAGDRGELRSPFDWEWLIIEQAPRGPLELIGERRDAPRRWTVEPGAWRAEVAPRVPTDLDHLIDEGKRRLDAGDPAQALEIWRSAFELTDSSEDSLASAWGRFRVARWLADAERFDDADTLFLEAEALTRNPFARTQINLTRAWAMCQPLRYEQALDELGRSLTETETATPSLLLAAIRFREGMCLRYSGHRFAAAANRFRQALALQEALAPRSLPQARTLSRLVELPTASGQPLLFEEANLAIEILEDLDPNGTELAVAFMHLGHLFLRIDDLEKAMGSYRRAVELARQRDPDSLLVAKAILNLAGVASTQGDLSQAEAGYQEALQILEDQNPNRVLLAFCLNNYGNFAMQRGDYALARQNLLRALEIKANLMPGTYTLAFTLHGLGGLAFATHDLEQAEKFLGEAQELFENLEPVGTEAAEVGITLGLVALARGDLGRAETFFDLGNLPENEEPRTPWLRARGALMQGRVAIRRGEDETAERRFLEALEIFTDLAPASLDRAEILTDLGVLALDQGELDRSEQRLRQALAVFSSKIPGTALETQTLHALGQLYRQRGEAWQALEYFEHAIKSLETQIGKLTDDLDRRGSFRARFGELYQDTTELLLELGRTDDALELQERFRARSFLALLKRRNLVFDLDLPSSLEQVRQRLVAEYDRLQYRRTARGRLDQPAGDELSQGQLQDLKRRWEKLREEIRRASPRFSTLSDPRPLAASQIRANLDPGTLMLLYHVGEKRSYLFVVDRSSTRAIPLAPGEKELRDRVVRFRNLIDRRRNPRSPGFASLVVTSETLFRDLVAPALESIRRAERLLILPDGPLHDLPFAALLAPKRADSNRGNGKFLVEIRPIHIALSATVYHHLRRLPDSSTAPPGSEQPTEVLAFGDPHYPESLIRNRPSGHRKGEDPRLGEVLRGLELGPLPASRLEVEAVARQFPDETRVFLGRDATESRAKSRSPKARYLHFATHGLLDERSPLDSSLVLTLPERYEAGKDNGLLQAWEIFESLRIQADLVVLSACSTARGKTAGGEGLIGLTRAFQYAGARSVLASQWNVSDRATTELMASFYRYLRAGMAKDEALRQAQLEMIQDSDATRDLSAPFYWSAFQLDGDWR